MFIGQHLYGWCSKEAGCEGITGFQTRAKSPSVTEDMERIIKRACSNYTLPRSLERLTSTPGRIKADEIAKCPTVISYYPISETLWGLTQSRLSADQSGRGGNFLAHTLVFAQDVLEPVDYDPLALVASGLFQFEIEHSSPKVLPEIAEISLPGKPIERSMDILRSLKGRQRGIIKELLSGLLASKTGDSNKRQCILVNDDYRTNSQIIEGCLLLLPKAYRKKLSFCTFEIDPYRQLVRDNSFGPPPPQCSIIGTVTANEGGKFQLRDDELKRFTVLDFKTASSNAESTTGRAFVSFVHESLGNTDLEGIVRLHSFLDSLAGPEDPTEWDRLAPAYLLFSSKETPNKFPWEECFAILSEYAKTERSASIAFHAALRRFLAAPGLPGKEDLIFLSGLEVLSKKAAASAKELVSSRTTEIIGCLSSSLERGAYCSGQKLFSIIKEADPSTAATALHGAIKAISSRKKPIFEEPATPEETGALLSLVYNAIEMGSESAPESASLQVLLGNVLTVCRSSSALELAWTQLWPTVSERMATWPVQSRRPLLKELHQLLARYPQQRLQLTIWELRHDVPAHQDAMLSILKLISNLLTLSSQPIPAVNTTTGALQEVYGTKPNEFVSALGVLYSHTGDEIQKCVLGELRKHVEHNANPDFRLNYRRALSSTPFGIDLLAADLTKDLFPWVSSESSERFKRIISEFIGANPRLSIAVAQRICIDMNSEAQKIRAEILSMSLQEFTSGKCAKESISVIAESLVRLSPIAAYRDEPFRKLLVQVDSAAWKSDSKALLQIGTYYSEFQGGLDIRALNQKIPNLPSVAAALPDHQWGEVSAWIVSTLKRDAFEDQESARIYALVCISMCRSGATAQSGKKGFELLNERIDKVSALVGEHFNAEFRNSEHATDVVTKLYDLWLLSSMWINAWRENVDTGHDPLTSLTILFQKALAHSSDSEKLYLKQRFYSKPIRVELRSGKRAQEFWKEVGISDATFGIGNSLGRKLSTLVSNVFGKRP